MKKAFSYLRVSSLGQVDLDGFVRQRETILRYAEANDYEIVEEFRDEGIPGKTEMNNRPGLAACLAACEANGVRTVIVEISDRLARDLVVNELIIREFQRLDVQVFSASGGVNLCAGCDQNPTARLVRQILAAVAEFDRAIIVLKTRAARERIRKAKGKCEGRMAYGTKQEEAATLRLILDYRDAGLDSLKITTKLNEARIKTRYGKEWNSGTVYRILSRNNPAN